MNSADPYDTDTTEPVSTSGHGIAVVGTEAGSRAEGLLQVLLICLKTHLDFDVETLRTKLVAVGADGCSVMQGQNNGVLTRVIKQCPHALHMLFRLDAPLIKLILLVNFWKPCQTSVASKI